MSEYDTIHYIANNDFPKPFRSILIYGNRDGVKKEFLIGFYAEGLWHEIGSRHADVKLILDALVWWELPYNKDGNVDEVETNGNIILEIVHPE